MTGPARDLFAVVADPMNLWQGWLRVKANRGGPGGDGETIAEFAPVAMARIARLAEELRAGLYAPGPLRRVAVEKDGGGTRTLAIPCVVDRVAQTAAAMVLSHVLEPEFEDTSYGYRPGRSVRMAVDRIAALRREGYGWVVDGDIRAFFDEVPHGRLLRRLARSVGDPRLVDLVRLWLEGFAEDGRGLPQGSPISPVLANLYLDDVDEAIAQGGVRLVRFADDFVLLCKSEARARGALLRMAALLAEHGLALNLDKTRVRSFEEGFRFLGRLFVRSLVLETEHDDPPPETAELELPPFEPDPPAAPAAEPRPAALLRKAPASEPPPEPTAPETTARQPARAPVIRPLYVLESGRRVELRNEAFAVLEDEVELLALPPHRVDRIDLGPYVAISDAALRQAVAYRVPVFLLNGHGEPLGSVEPAASRRFDLHLDQAACVLDPARRLDLARRLVDGRLRNQQALLRRLNRRRKDAAVDRAVEAIKRCRRRLPGAGEVAGLLGLEGEGGRHYWPALGRCFEHGFGFERRRRHPAPDAPNAVLNWLAALVTRDLQALVLRRGLHPGFGALHTAQHGHAAAAFDLVEEFRSPLAEGLAVYLFNNRVLAADDFALIEGEGVRLVGPARATLIRHYEAWLDRPVRSPRSGVQTSWRGLMDEQIEAYVAHVGGRAPYEAYRMDY